MYDGGCKIMGYILEMQQKGEDKWERCNDFLVPVLSYTVRGLKEGKNYTFRVKAENAAGVSEPSRNTPFIKASDAVGKGMFPRILAKQVKPAGHFLLPLSNSLIHDPFFHLKPGG